MALCEIQSIKSSDPKEISLANLFYSRLGMESLEAPPPAFGLEIDFE
jgi:hypothetical protein